MSTTINFQPALIGGLALGVLSALPFVAAGNCCCLWVTGGGIVAAYLLQQSQPTPITSGDGALIGFIAGIIGAVVYLLVSIPVDLVFGPMQRELLRRLMENMNGGSDAFRQFAERSIPLPVRIAVNFVGMLFISAIFSTVGGLIGAAVFRKNLPPGTVDVPASSS